MALIKVCDHCATPLTQNERSELRQWVNGVMVVVTVARFLNAENDKHLCDSCLRSAARNVVGQ